MPTRKLADKNIRKLTRMGRAGASFGITLPKEMIADLGWKEKQKVVAKRVRRGILIKDWPARNATHSVAGGKK